MQMTGSLNMAKWSLFSLTRQKKSEVAFVIELKLLIVSVDKLHYPQSPLSLRLRPPGERPQCFCGLQHPGEPDPLRLVRQL